MSDAETAPAPSADLDFDSLLAPSASAPRAAAPAATPSVGATAAPQLAARPAHEEQPTWHDFVDNWSLYRDPVLCGVTAGAVLGVLGVFVVLRRAVFVTAAGKLRRVESEGAAPR